MCVLGRSSWSNKQLLGCAGRGSCSLATAAKCAGHVESHLVKTKHKRVSETKVKNAHTIIEVTAEIVKSVKINMQKKCVLK